MGEPCGRLGSGERRGHEALMSDSALEALTILAAVYRRARAMWPRSAADEGKSVTVFVDELKACTRVDAVMDVYTAGKFWLVVKRSESEAAVETRSLDDLPKVRLLARTRPCTLGVLLALHVTRLARAQLLEESETWRVLPLWGVTAKCQQLRELAEEERKERSESSRPSKRSSKVPTVVVASSSADASSTLPSEKRC